MSKEKAKSADVVSGALVAKTCSGEAVVALGRFDFECIGVDGKVRWKDSAPNLVVNQGLQYMAGTSLDGATVRITSWFIGLWGAAALNTPAATDTLASHSGWAENTSYGGNRKACTFAAATTAMPSVVTNSASVAQFSMNATTTIGGAFLCSVNSGTSGTLFSGSSFTSSDRAVISGDTINVTYTLSLSA